MNDYQMKVSDLKEIMNNRVYILDTHFYKKFNLEVMAADKATAHFKMVFDHPVLIFHPVECDDQGSIITYDDIVNAVKEECYLLYEDSYGWNHIHKILYDWDDGIYQYSSVLTTRVE